MSSVIRAALVFAVLGLAVPAYTAEVIVVPGDPPGVGFNDPTPATPVGGNTGTTVGQQALNVFQRAADRWGANLVSDQPIFVIAFFTPLTCDETSAVLGGAAPLWSFADVPAAGGGKPLAPGTWYPAALAEKITRQDIVADPSLPFEIYAVFNSSLGQPGCLTGRGWYYGLDNREPANRTDLLAVVLHEFGHGLGFTAGPTNAATGARAQGLPSIWERHLLDLSTGKRWLQMTDAERAASAKNTDYLVWAGQQVTNVIPSVLDFRAELRLHEGSALQAFEAQAAAFGPTLTGQSTQGYLVAATDAGGISPTDGCEAFGNTSGLAGRIALVDRGNCTFVQKVLNAQLAGASGVVVANNVPVGLPGMAGTDPRVKIPSIGITQALGTALRAAGQPYVELWPNPLQRTGTTETYARMYAPAAFSGGSSVSHFDVTLFPNVLMEPFINSDLGSNVKNPDDLTKSLFMDIGW